MTTTEPQPESISVQMTRMEGILNLVADRVSSLISRVDRHEGELGELKSLTQTLREGADADKKTAVALALALKEADETRRTQDGTVWTPFSRFAAAVTLMATVVGLYIAYRAGA